MVQKPVTMNGGEISLVGHKEWKKPKIDCLGKWGVRGQVLI